jgi:hypothetical protein
VWQLRPSTFSITIIMPRAEAGTPKPLPTSRSQRVFTIIVA